MSPKAKVSGSSRDTAVVDRPVGALPEGAVAEGMSTAPKPQRKPIGGSLRDGSRYWWRQLTSMRTALVLLFLLALASIPGSLLPQRSLNASRVTQYFAENPTLAPILDKLGFFNVFTSVWFSAVYLLLFTSLVGCLIPRIKLHLRNLRSRPPVTPRRLDRLAEHARGDLDAAAEQVIEEAEALLRKQRWRVERRTGRDGALTLSAEKGYLRETGNLVFHCSLLALLVSLALGSLNSYEGSLLLTEGEGFCNTPQQYDNFRSGALVDGEDLTPLCVDLKDFTTSYDDANGVLTPSAFTSEIDWQSVPGAAAVAATIGVNDPLRKDGVRVYTTGHGFAPVFTVKTASGRVLENQSAPFLPSDPTTLGSEGVVNILDTGDPFNQIAIEGFFAPTASNQDGIIVSTSPKLLNPAVAIRVFQGSTGVNTGRPQSVFTINQSQVDKGVLKQVGAKNLNIGDTLTLDDGTTVTFTGVREWAAVQLSHDPAQLWVLGSSVVMLVGLMLSLRLRRRRMWVRVRSGGDGPSAVELGGLAHTQPQAFAAEFARISGHVLQRPQREGDSPADDVPEEPPATRAAPRRPSTRDNVTPNDEEET